VPQGVFSTEAARSMLPEKVDRTDAIFNIARVAVLIQAMSSGNLELLKNAMQDKMHSPSAAGPRSCRPCTPALRPRLQPGQRARACTSTWS